MILLYAFCNVPVMPLRSEPSHRAEQSSQLLFGEKAEILELNKQNWARIRCHWDDYEGWCNFSQLTIITRKQFIQHTKYMVGSNKDSLLFDKGVMCIPFGGELMGMKGAKTELFNEVARFKGKKIPCNKQVLSSEAVSFAAFQFLFAPYQWGGRSIAGIDCSGLSQMAYKYCNFPIPRNAQEQSEVGKVVDFLENGKCGDLAFFDNEAGKINHVGILLDNKTIIHASEASGRVAIDVIDNNGIISKIHKKRTHKLRIVKRLIP